MDRVRVLPDHLANQIAAGEVVERPASALKELLENSFDAGATRIRVSLEAGGKRRIRVEDNGRGMDRDDCLMALERHATSKLTRTEDLFSIKTLGFRGEALPSIASVSRFSIESKTAEGESGTRMEMHGSKLFKVSEVSRNQGTTVNVESLFFNIPARKKFLRKTETELAWMVNLVTQYSLAHLDKHFYLEHNGRVLMDIPPVSNLKERIYQHFGKKMIEELVPFSQTIDWLRIHGLASTPNFFKTSRNYQYLFVNGRMVKDRVLNHAIHEAYSGFGEGRVYPVIFLFVELPPAELDVNVHPAKTEIKFIQGGVVHDSVRETIRKVLVDQKLTIPYRFRADYHAHPSQVNPRRIDPWQQTLKQPGDPGREPPAATTTTVDDANPYQRFLERNRELVGKEPAAVTAYNSATAPTAPPAQADPQEPSPEVSQPSGSSSTVSAPDSLFSAFDSALSLPNIIGQFRESYILAEQEGDLLLIDQHVAHERILYDDIVASLERNAVECQTLLVPVQIELTPHQAVELTHLMPSVKRFGFDLDPFDGNSFILREIPLFAQGQDLESLVRELIEKAQGQRDDTVVETMIDHFAATKACKAAVKINMRLTPEKMRHLLARLWASSSPMFCPHGRPIILRFRNEEIEKNFLRR